MLQCCDIKGGREEEVIDTDYCNVNIIVLVYECQPTLFLARSILYLVSLSKNINFSLLLCVCVRACLRAIYVADQS